MTIAIVLTLLLLLIIGIMAFCVEEEPLLVFLIIAPVVVISILWYECGMDGGYSQEKLTEMGYGEYYLDKDNEKQWRFVVEPNKEDE